MWASDQVRVPSQQLWSWLTHVSASSSWRVGRPEGGTDALLLLIPRYYLQSCYQQDLQLCHGFKIPAVSWASWLMVECENILVYDSSVNNLHKCFCCFFSICRCVRSWLQGSGLRWLWWLRRLWQDFCLEAAGRKTKTQSDFKSQRSD